MKSFGPSLSDSSEGANRLRLNSNRFEPRLKAPNPILDPLLFRRLATVLLILVLTMVVGTALFEQLPHQFFSDSWFVPLLSLNFVLFAVLLYVDRRSQNALNAAVSRFEEGEERFRQVAENLRDQVFYIASPGRDRMIYVSPAFERIWGYPVEPLMNDSLAHLERIHPDDKLLLLESYERQRQGEKTSIEIRFIHRDGSVHWILDRAFPVRDRNGNLIRIAGIAEDVSAQKQLERERASALRKLEESTEKYKRLFNANPQPMWILDSNTRRFLEVNDAAIRSFGYSREELVQMSLADLERTIRPVNERTAVITCKDGQEIHVEVNANELDYDGQQARLAALTDVTAMVRARRAAVEASEAKSRFLANMSHEIRTPLGAILGFAELMEDPEQTTSDRIECLSTIRRNGARLSQVINDILDLSKIESNRLDIERISFNPIELIQEVVNLLKIQAQAKKLELAVSSEGFLPYRVLTDPTRLRQILINIIGNAIKFTTEGKIEIQVEAVAMNTAPTLRFVVRDTGPGIPVEHQEKIFRPFAQADASTARVFGGTGLGLSLSQKLAAALGGDVRLLESVEGVGTAFEITVGIGSREEIAWLSEYAQREDDERRRESFRKSNELHSNEKLLGHTKVLLADDAPDNRILVKRFLVADGAEVETAENGEEALNQALAGDFNVVLMDIEMPKMDGFTAVRRLREMGFSKPVVALTAHAMKGDRERCLEAGFDDYVVKPIDRRELVETIVSLKGKRTTWDARLPASETLYPIPI